MSQNNFYITTPIYYPSGDPHMGHAYSSILADVFARFKRNDNNNVFFLTGTDEHGLKIQTAARNTGLDPLVYCDKISLIFKDLTTKLNLSNDDFIRTTEKRHHKSVSDLWDRLVKSGDIYLSKYKGWYSVSDEAYYNPDEIIEKNGKKFSTFSGSQVEWVEEDSFFFKLSSWQKKLLEFYDNNSKFILPISRRNEVVNFVKSGLNDLSVSRTSFTWGIKVPNNDKHVIYVWLDALTNYLSALNFPDTNDKLYKKFWPASLHVIGKDILRFHAVYWPAFLLAAKIKPPNRVFGHGWILSGEEKMSKSKGNILDPIEIIKKYGLDPLRYYLIKEVSFGNDGNISKDKLKSCTNSDLANNYGNLCQRVILFNEKNLNLEIPQKDKFSQADLNVLDVFKSNFNKLIDYIDNQDINSYVNFIVDQLFSANKYFNDQEPWKKKSDVKRLNTIVYVSLELIRKITILLYPIIPESSLKVLKAFDITENKINFNSITNNEYLKPKLKIKKIGILFKKIENND